MVIDKDLVGLNDIANICGTSNNNVSNWRKRDPKFPEPYSEISGMPIWKTEDILDYLKCKSEIEYDVISTGNLSTKRVVIIGRARGGKSFIIALFVNDRAGFMKLFCGNSSDKTACPVHVKISEYIALESFVFHTDFSSIYQDDREDIVEIKDRISKCVDISYSQEEVEKMNEIETLIRDMRKIEEEFKGRRESNTYIDTFQKPSKFCKELLRECKLGSIEVIDTPGVSGNVNAAKVTKADLYLFLVKPDNTDESQTLKKIVEKIKPDVAMSKVSFLYKKEGMFFTKEDYEIACEEVKAEMMPYSELFAELKTSIVATDLDVLDPAGHCIPFPTMRKDRLTPPEEFFLEDMRKKLIEAFNQDETAKDEEFKKVMATVGNSARDLVMKILQNIPQHEIEQGESAITAETVMGENHDRVMTNDHYRFRRSLDEAYGLEANLLDRYFASFLPEDYAEDWQRIIIKYVYRKLITSIRTDRGLGVGSHPREEQPVRTMLVEESIFADTVLAFIENKNQKSRNVPYRNALRSCNIKSVTWNYVGCNDDEEAYLKLKLVKDLLLSKPVYSRKDLVLQRYIGGLRKVAEYKLLQRLGYDDRTIEETLRNLPF